MRAIVAGCRRNQTPSLVVEGGSRSAPAAWRNRFLRSALILGVGLFNVCPGLAAPDAGTNAARSPAANAASQPASHPAQGSLNLKEPTRGEQDGLGDKPGGLHSLVTVGGSLAAVLGAFLLLAWLMRKASPHGSAILPTEVFESLGRAPLANRQQVQLLRCGSKLLLVSITPTGVETLAEITDAAEVDRLVDLCKPNRSQGAAATFRRVLEQTGVKRGSNDVNSATATAAQRTDEREQGHA